VDLYDVALKPENNRDAFYATSLRDIEGHDLIDRLWDLPTLLILPKWVGGTVVSRSMHDSVLIPRGELTDLARQLHLPKASVIRPDTPGFLEHQHSDGLVTLFHPQLFDLGSLPETCKGELSLPQGVLIARCQLHPDQPLVYILSDPDLLNNHGLPLAENASVALAAINRILARTPVEDSSAEPSKDPLRIYLDRATHNLVSHTEISDQRQDYDRSYENFARFFAPPLNILWAILLLVLAVALWRGARRFGPPAGSGANEPEQSKQAIIDTNARLLRIAGQDARLVSDLVHANLADQAQMTFGRTAGVGHRGVMRLFIHLARRDGPATAELQAVVAQLTDTTQTSTHPAELSRQLEKFHHLLEKLTDAR
jgi:hypothetical protein